MATAGGPDIIEDGIVLALDAANNKGISPAANEEFNNSDQFVKNLIDRSQSITANNGVKVGNLNYYTAFAIDYPENSFGGSAAGRDGITAGFNVTSGTKTHEYGRALHFHIWDDSAGGWISNSNFNGDGSFRYDTWGGYANASTQVAQFVTDYNNLKEIYPDDTYIIAGSHRDSTHTTDKINILLDLGAPSNVSSLLDGSPEWILVGKPGLGAGNAYVWAFENYSTDAIRVAHAVFPLPINKINKDNYFEFDGTNDYITTANTTIADSQTFSVWAMVTGGPDSPAGILTQHNYASTANFGINHISGNKLAPSIGYTNGTREFSSKPTNFTITHNEIFNAVLVYNHSENKIYWYINGQLDSSYTLSLTPKSTNYPICVGRWDATYNDYYFNGKVYSGHIHNRALTASEVLQNYNATKGRFGL